MPPLGAADAEALARSALGVPAAEPADALLVERLDRAGQAYYLVMFGPPEGPTAVATVDATSGAIMNSARLGVRQPHLAVTRERAIELARLREPATVSLVWCPCRASRSPFSPIWRVAGASATVFVDQQGVCWKDLTPTIA